MRILVTGGAGAIGGNLVKRLAGDPEIEHIVVLDDLSSGKRENLAHHGTRVEFLQGDIPDPQAVARAMQGIEFVIHEAAWRSVPKSMSDPYGYTEVNVLATASLLEAAVKEKVKRFVCISSSSVYGDTKEMPLREEMPTYPISPYAASKLIDEVLFRLYPTSFSF